MNKKLALDLFLQIIEDAEIEGTEPKHVLRWYEIEQISPNQFHITYERHPHLYGKSSIGKASSAYATVRKTYLIDTQNKTAEFIEDNVVDINIDYHELAMEEVSSLMDALSSERDKLKKIESEEEKEKYAESVFNQIEWIGDNSKFKSEYDPDNSFDFEKYKKELKEVFMDEFLRSGGLF